VIRGDCNTENHIMRTLTLSIGICIAVLAAPLLAADTPSQKKKSPHASGLRFSVPYSFANVRKELKNAIIRCDVLAKGAPMFGGSVGPLGADLPNSGFSMPTAIGSGSVVIALNGQPRSGTALVIPTPKAGASFDDATQYLCVIQVNNGFQTISPGTGANVPLWARSQGGSQLGATGAIK
jgi:hypothetical protein